MSNVNYEIDIKKMLYNILKKWKIICIVMLACAVTFNFVYVYKQFSSAEVEEKYENVLTKKEKTEVDYTYETYKLYQERLEQKTQYLQHSAKMHIDSQNEVKCVLQYAINTDNSNGVLDGIISSYISGIKNNDLYNEVEKVTDGQIDSRYVSELIGTSRNNVDGMVENNATTGTFNVVILASDTQQCEKIIDVVQNAIDAIYKDNTDIYGNYTITKVLSNMTIVVDTDLFETQNKLKEEITTLQKNILNVTKSLSDKQLEYYKEKYPQDEEEIQSYISFKYVILGLGVGFIVVFMIYLLKYILLNKLKFSDEFKLRWNIETIDTPIVVKEKKSLDKVLDRTLNKNNTNRTYKEQIEHLSLEIKMLIECNNIKDLLITGTVDTDEVQELAKNIQSDIKIQDVNINVVSSILNNNKALSNLSNADSVIFIEQIMQSSYNDIDKEIKLCKNLNKQILGAVIISD